MFENLTNKFEEIFSSLKKAPSLDEKQVETLRKQLMKNWQFVDEDEDE